MQKEVKEMQLCWDLFIFTGLKDHLREPSTTVEPAYTAVLQPTDQAQNPADKRHTGAAKLQRYHPPSLKRKGEALGSLAGAIWVGLEYTH